MQRLTFIRDYTWLKLMDVLCWFRGHSCGEFPKGRFCRRCFNVENVDFEPDSLKRASRVRRLVRRIWHSLRGHQLELLRCEVAVFWWEYWLCSCGREEEHAIYNHPHAGLLRVGKRVRYGQEVKEVG